MVKEKRKFREMTHWSSSHTGVSCFYVAVARTTYLWPFPMRLCTGSTGHATGYVHTSVLELRSGPKTVRTRVSGLSPQQGLTQEAVMVIHNRGSALFLLISLVAFG